MGSWSANANCGDILGSISAGVLLGAYWPVIVLIETARMCISAIVFLIVVRNHPADQSPAQKRAYTFWEAFALPGVAVYSLDYAFVKLLNYGMLFWLPYFLENHLHVNGLHRGLIAASYDVGAVFGSGVTGWASDKVQSRVLVLTPMLALAIPLLYCLRLGESEWPYFIMVPLLGWVVGGSANVLTSAAAADLAKHKDSSGTPVESTATVAGIIDGTGSIGAGLGQLLIGYLRNISWDLAFGFLMGTH